MPLFDNMDKQFDCKWRENPDWVINWFVCKHELNCPHIDECPIWHPKFDRELALKSIIRKGEAK